MLFHRQGGVAEVCFAFSRRESEKLDCHFLVTNHYLLLGYKGNVF